VYRVVGEVRVCDVALHAVHGESSGQRAPTADLDRIAERLVARRLADHAPVDLVAARLEHLHDPARPVHGRPFLVAGEQEGQCAAVVGVARQEPLRGRHHGRKTTFHVGRAATVEDSVADDGLERVGMPVLARPGRDDVGVTGEAEQGLSAASGRPEVVDWAVLQAFVAEPKGLEPGTDDVEAAVVLGTHGWTAQQVFSKGQRG
jgi:hypothetical protein